jgi:hypothetical protein
MEHMLYMESELTSRHQGRKSDTCGLKRTWPQVGADEAPDLYGSSWSPAKKLTEILRNNGCDSVFVTATGISENHPAEA